MISNAPGRAPPTATGRASARGARILASYARLYAVWVAYADRVGYEEGFVFGGGSAVIAPDGRELEVADPLESEELTAVLDAAELRRARIANPAHGIERHEMLIEALRRAAATEARITGTGERREAQR